MTRPSSLEPDHTKGRVTDFGMDTLSMTGPLEGKLAAARQAGFTQIMLSARDLAEHPGGMSAAVECVRESGLRVTGLQVRRDFHRLRSSTHPYEVEIAKSLLEMCAAVGAQLLVVSAPTSSTFTTDIDSLAKDLRKLAILAVPLGIKIAYEGVCWSQNVNDFPAAWEVAWRADMPNLGICIDSFHMLANQTSLDELEALDVDRIFLVQLADFTWDEAHTLEQRVQAGRHFQVFPGEGVHSQRVAALVRSLHALGYRGDFSFDVFNDDYQQLPAQTVAQRAYLAALWLGETILRRSVPMPNQLKLRRLAPSREAIPSIEP